MISVVFQVTKSFPVDVYEDRICVAFYNEWAKCTEKAIKADTERTDTCVIEKALFIELDDAYEFESFLTKFFKY